MTMSTEQTKVAFFMPNLNIGGAERAMSLLASAFAAHDIPTDFVLVQAKGELLSNLSKKVCVVNLGASSTYTCLPSLISYLCASKPNAMISALDLTNLLALIARSLVRYPKKLYVRLDSTQSVVKRSYPKKKLEKIFIRAIYPWADRVIAISQSVAEDFIKYTGISSKQISVINNPIITDDIYNKAQQPVRHPWFTPTEPPIILAVGRLVYSKNFSILLKAFAKVRQTRRVHLVILGEGEQRNKLLAQAAELNIIKDILLPGVQRNPYAYMSHASVFVLSSHYEGMPTVLVEALACGCPVVSTDCPSGPREILDNGKYGYLVPVNDEDALAEAINSALVHPKPIPEVAWLEQFTLENVVQAYLDLIVG